MRFFKDRPDILIPIVWYWVDREDVITWPNAFVSQDWDTIKPVDGCPVGEVGMQPWERKAAWRDGSRPPQANDGPTPCGTPSQWSEGALFADAMINPCQCAGVKGTGRQVQWGEGKFVSPWPLGIGRGDMIETGTGDTPDVDQGVGRLIETGTGDTPDVDQGVGRLVETGAGQKIGPDLTVGGPAGPHSSGHYTPGTANVNVGFNRGYDVFAGGPSENVPDVTVGDVLPDPTPGTDCEDALVCEVGHSYGPFAVRGLDQYWFTIDSPSGGSTFSLDYDDPPEGGQVMTVYTGTCSTLTFESNVTDNPGSLPEGPRILRLQIFAIDPSLYRNVTINFS